MQIRDILSPADIVINTEAESKKIILDRLSALAASKTGFEKSMVLDALIERERLGSTGVGRGVALPHTRLIGLEKIFCAFMKTAPIDFEAVDSKSVDLIFLLLVPEEAGADHLKALSHLSSLLRDEAVAESLRKAKTAEELYKIIVENDFED